jgi:hypothetical protein
LSVWQSIGDGDEDPAVQKYPTGQIVHVSEVVALDSEEYVPGEQGTGAVIPESAQKNPLGHG